MKTLKECEDAACVVSIFEGRGKEEPCTHEDECIIMYPDTSIRKRVEQLQKTPMVVAQVLTDCMKCTRSVDVTFMVDDEFWCKDCWVDWWVAV